MMLFNWTDDGSGTATGMEVNHYFYYSNTWPADDGAGVSTETVDTTGSDWTAVTGAYSNGMEKTWVCTTTGVETTDSTVDPTGTLTITCSRFQPTVYNSGEDDFRFTPDATAYRLGEIDGTSATDFTLTGYNASGADVYVWAGAFEAAAVAGVALVATLAF